MVKSKKSAKTSTKKNAGKGHAPAKARLTPKPSKKHGKLATKKITLKLRKPKDKTKLKLSNAKAKNALQKNIGEKELKKKQIDLDLQRINDLLSQAYARQLLIDLGGENALAIIRNFSENLNDEELAKRLKIRISDVRATLNRLHNEGLVNYSRERDNESGWYSYTWSLNKERIKEWVGERSRNPRIEIESKGDHYFCPSCGVETLTPFEKAVEDGFKCQKCEHSLEFIDEMKANELFDSNRERVLAKK